MENTAKNFALQLGAVASLYTVVISLISLLFGVITVAFPDSAQGSWEHDAASTGIRVSIAFLIVFFPVYIALTRILNVIRRKETGVYLTLTKWILYLSLFVGGAVLLGDCVSILVQFLNGEITIRFILKSLTVLVVVGIACAYYLADVRDYWQNHEKNSIYYGIAVGLFVLASLVLGFAHTDSPSVVREKRIDSEQINILMGIQSTIESYISAKQKLPESLEEAYEGLTVPSAPKERSPFTYEVKSGSLFKLCADFAFENTENEFGFGFVNPDAIIKSADSWNHGEGKWCFERAVNLGAVSSEKLR